MHMNKLKLISRLNKRGRFLYLPLLIMVLLISCQPDPVQPEYEPSTIIIRGRILPSPQFEMPVAVFIPGFPWISTDKDGYFSFELEPGEIENDILELFAYSHPYAPILFEEISAHRLMEEEDLRFNVGTVSVTFPDKEPEVTKTVKGRVSLYDREEHHGILVLIQETGKTTTTSPDGEYVFHNLPAGNYTLHFYKDSFQQYTLQNVRIPSANTFEVQTVTLSKHEKEERIAEQRGTVSGRIRLISIEGKTIPDAEGVKVSLINTPFETVSDRMGGFSFDNLPHGNYFLEADFQGFDDHTTSFYLNTSSLALPLIRLNEIESPHYGTVQGSIIMPDDKPDFTIVALKGSQAVGFADEKGDYQIERITPGVYDLLIKAEGFKTLTLPQINIQPNVVTNIPAVNLQIVEDPPRVVTTLPADGQSNIRVQQQVEAFIVFSTKMDIPSTKRAIRISPSVSYDLYMGKEHAKSDWDTALLVLYAGDVSNPVQFNKTYTVTIDKNAHDLNHNTMEEEHVFSFTTGRGRILRSSPRHNEANVSLQAYNPIIIHFNCKIDEESFKRAFQITPSSPTQSSFSFYETGEGWTVARVEVSLNPDTRYRVVIGNALRTWDKTSLENTPFTIEFDTYRRN